MSAPENWPECSGVDVTRPAVARVYDCLLGGKDNYAVDRRAAADVVAVFPQAPVLARANRLFAARAARWCAAQGIDQFVDVGTGLPTAPSLFEVVGAERPDAVVVGVDNDPVVLCHDRAFLARIGSVIAGDIRGPGQILKDLAALIDFERPVAVFLVAVLHLLRDAEDPAGIVAAFREALAPGSLVVISHVCSTGSRPDVVTAIEHIYARADSPLVFRAREEILDLFAGLELLEPGLIDVAGWRPDEPAPPMDVKVLGGVGRVPGPAGLHADLAAGLNSALEDEVRADRDRVDPRVVAGEVAVITAGRGGSR